MKSRRSKTLHETVELNITAFLNLMVILVPFLLITAVFSRMTVLELTLPELNSEQAADEDKKVDFNLQLAIYPGFMDLRESSTGRRIRKFDIVDGEINWKPVTEVLLEIKRRYPEETAITLLLDKKVPYKRLIEVMDKVRSTDVVVVTDLEAVELFPDVSIGDAPELIEGAEPTAEATTEEAQ